MRNSIRVSCIYDMTSRVRARPGLGSYSPLAPSMSVSFYEDKEMIQQVIEETIIDAFDLLVS